MKYDCEYWKRLDRKFGTSEASPLHHDQRCVSCLLTANARAKAVVAR